MARPVVTWERLGDGTISYGVGFQREGVEVLLPISPEVCLHILPAVERTRVAVTPSVTEVNKAQAMFCLQHCYANQKNSELDDIVQNFAGMVRIGENAFNLSHRNFEELFYQLLMGIPPS